jgi:hypothetical protein
MNRTSIRLESWVTRLRSSPIGIFAFVLFTVGLGLGVTAHKGFLIMMALGAFGPGLLRQFGWLDDLDEFQKEAAAKSGYRAYLAGALFLMVALISEGWDRPSVGDERISTRAVVTIMLVVYYTSYCLSFWDTRKAVSRVLFAFGLWWLAFVVLSNSREPMSMLMEGLAVPGPFLVGAVLCRWWPRGVGVLLLAASVGTVFFFHLLPLGETDSAKLFQNAFMIALFTLPLAVSGVALVTSKREDEDRKRLITAGR